MMKVRYRILFFIFVFGWFVFVRSVILLVVRLGSFFFVKLIVFIFLVFKFGSIKKMFVGLIFFSLGDRGVGNVVTFEFG